MNNLRRVITISIVFLLSLFYINTVNAANTAKVASDTVRIRKEANTNSTILELISLNEEVEVLEKENDWYKIKYKEITGYVKADLLSLNETEEEKKEETPEETQNPQTKEQNVENEEENKAKSAELTVNQEITTKSEVKLKIIPLINSSDIITINTSTKVQVKEIINDWSYIQSEVGSGWVRNNTLITMIESEETSKEEDKKEDESDKEDKDNKKEETATTKTGYVNVATVNVRKEMSTSSTILSNLSKNAKVTILSEKNNWSYVEVNGIKGYIASKYLSDKKVDTSVTSRSSDESRAEKEEQQNVEEIKTEETTNNTIDTTQNNETEIKQETTKNETTSKTEETNQEVKKETESEKTEATKEETAKTKDNKAETTATSNKGSQVVSYAKKYLGYKYVYGSASPSKGFDCSGFTSYVYKHFGISLSRTSSGQRSNGKAVKKSDLQPGDIVCFTGHVGIYIGGNKFIHAANPKKGVIITSMSDSYYKKTYITARRVL